MEQELSHTENLRTVKDVFDSTAKAWELTSKSTSIKGKALQVSTNSHRPFIELKSLKDSKQIVAQCDKENKQEEITKDEIIVKNQDTLIQSDIIERLADKTEVDDQEEYEEEAAADEYDEEDAAIIQDFYDDNEERYEQDDDEDEEFIGIVPVLPIIVPQRLRHVYFKEEEETEGSSLLSTKRQLEDPENKHTEKKQRKDTPLFAPNAPPLQFGATAETIELDRQQEDRARQAMLGTTQSLREDQWNDPMLVAEYASEIFCNLYDAEPTMLADPGYANSQQHEVTWKMRSVLIDWIIEIHYLFGLLPETLFLTVNIIDRFLSLRTVALGKLQLVGITALFLATKFEEIVCPTLKDFLFMTDNAVTEDDMIKAERFILQNLDFRLCLPHPLNFLRRICTDELECDVHTRTLAKYFMEATTIDHRFLGVRPSKIAAAALWLSRKMLVKGKWTTKYTQQAGYSASDLKPVVETMLDFLAQPITHDAFFKKWSSKKFSKASIFVRDWVNRYYLSSGSNNNNNNNNS